MRCNVLLLLFLCVRAAVAADSLYLAQRSLANNKTIQLGIVWPVTLPPSRASLVDLVSYEARTNWNYAMAAVNNDSTVLEGYKLEWIWSDNYFDDGKSFFAAFDLCEYGGQLIVGGVRRCTLPVIFGALLNSQIISVQTVVSRYGTPQMAPSGSSTALADRSLYPTFNRMVPDDALSTLALVKACVLYGWKEVAIFTTTGQQGGFLSVNFAKQAKAHNITILATQGFPDGSVIPVIPQVELIRDSGARVIYLGMSSNDVSLALSAIYELGLYGPPYTYLISSFTNPAGMRAANIRILDGAIGARVLTSFTNDQYKNYLSGWRTYVRSPEAKALMNFNMSDQPKACETSCYNFDGFRLVAYAIDKLVALERRCNFTGEGVAADLSQQEAWDCANLTASRFNENAILLRMMREVEFDGVTGHISMDKEGNRIGEIGLVNIFNATMRAVGLLTRDNQLAINTSALIWPSGLTGEAGIPLSAPETIYTVVEVPAGDREVMSGFAYLGIAYSMIFVVMNSWFRKMKLIKLSSPYINLLSLAGCILCYIAILFMGQSSVDGGESASIERCMSRAWLLSIGFTLAFGSLFAKTFRVYRIFRRKMKVVKLSNLHLFSIITCLVLVDIIVLSIWSATDWPTLDRAYGASTVLSYDVKSVAVVETCTSKNISIWMGVLLAYKGLLLLFGSWFAFEVRSVEIKELNDSKPVGVAIYTVSLICAMLVPLSFIITEPRTNYLFTAVISFLTITLLPSIMFLPRLAMLITGNSDVTSLSQPNNTSGNATTPSNKRHISGGKYQAVNGKSGRHLVDSTNEAGRQSVNEAGPAGLADRIRELEAELASLRTAATAAANGGSVTISIGPQRKSIGSATASAAAATAAAAAGNGTEPTPQTPTVTMPGTLA